MRFRKLEFGKPLTTVVWMLLIALLTLAIMFPIFRGVLLERRWGSITIGMTRRTVVDRLGQPTEVLAVDLKGRTYKGLVLKPGTRIPKGAFLYLNPSARMYCYVLFDSSGKVIETEVFPRD